MSKYCGGCGKRIWPWQDYVTKNLNKNSLRSAMQVKIHTSCWIFFPDGAK